jgi:hypothetical protein
MRLLLYVVVLAVAVWLNWCRLGLLDVLVHIRLATVPRLLTGVKTCCFCVTGIKTLLVINVLIIASQDYNRLWILLSFYTWAVTSQSAFAWSISCCMLHA